MKTIGICACVLLALLCPAWAEEAPAPADAWLPEDAEYLGEEAADGLRLLRYRSLGRALTLAAEDGQALWLRSGEQPPAAFAERQTRAEAEAVLAGVEADVLVLSCEEAQSAAAGYTPVRLWFISAAAAGWADVGEGRIVGCDLVFGVYLRDGRLTMSGAWQALRLHRPEAKISSIELDEDDGLLLYEGEADLGGVEYEFEIDARSGRLLEWER